MQVNIRDAATVHRSGNNNKGSFTFKVEVKDQPAKVETVDQQVLAGDTVQQQGVVL